ncbi:unnamed protein product [Pleuronectes platessa]|uniref:Uncharacterized protein n=1 Tax=Pleuronectes platessa TaxID=8262 RepID=A0A9N7TM61_PLEPL|nr:unnamed protein product [Pleuronectes platessa]
MVQLFKPAAVTSRVTMATPDSAQREMMQELIEPHDPTVLHQQTDYIQRVDFTLRPSYITPLATPSADSVCPKAAVSVTHNHHQSPVDWKKGPHAVIEMDQDGAVRHPGEEVTPPITQLPLLHHEGMFN